MKAIKLLPRRQRLRRTLLWVSFLLFPITMFYLSPVLILEASSQSLVSGSLVMFAALLLGAMFLGRAWCGWACPGAGLQDSAETINPKRVTKGRWIKWAIWVPWLGSIVFFAAMAGGFREVDFFFGIEHGISISEAKFFIVYYIVIGLFGVLAVAVGRRAACHTVCWMAPFMIIGRWLSNAMRLPALRLHANASQCIDCELCTTHCPMSLPVHTMVKKEDMDHRDCILCGTCLDSCKKDSIRFVIKPPQARRRAMQHRAVGLDH